MTFRFFVVLYVLAIISLSSWTVYLLATEVHPSQINNSHYQAKCLSNDKYVILQGSSTPYEFLETDLNASEFMNIKQDLNFYCKYYEQIEPHIQAYINAKTYQEQYQANLAYFKFEESVGRNFISRTPVLYSLETIKVENNYKSVLLSIVTSLIPGVVFFLVLQIARIIYLYIVFGKIIWHPFKKPSTLN